MGPLMAFAICWYQIPSPCILECNLESWANDLIFLSPVPSVRCRWCLLCGWESYKYPMRAPWRPWHRVGALEMAATATASATNVPDYRWSLGEIKGQKLVLIASSIQQGG